jgi:hypothetical protein
VLTNAACCALVVGLVGALPPASAGAGLLSSRPAPLVAQASCRAGKINGFRLYCHVAVKFKLDARTFSFKGRGTCGHGHGAWGFSAGPGGATKPAKGWTLAAHFGTQDYGKAVDKDGKYGPANGYDEINVSLNLKAGTFVPPESSLGVIDHAATISLSSGMTRGSYRARVAWVYTARPHLLVGTFRCW